MTDEATFEVSDCSALSVLVIPSWYPDGEHPTGGIFVAQQVRALRERGVDVAVLFYSEQYAAERPAVMREDGVLVARTGWPASLHRTQFGRRLQTLGRLVSIRLPAFRRRVETALSLLLEEGLEPDIVHVHALWHAGAVAAVVRTRLGVPVVVTEHSEEYSAYTERLLLRVPGVLQCVLRPLARTSSAYIAVSNQLALRLGELKIASDVRVIPNVVPGRTVVTRQGGRSPSRILHVSQLGPAKNIPLLLRAVSEVSQRRHDFVLDIAGDSPFRQGAEELAARLGILDRYVRFVGRLTSSQVQAALDAAAFAVLSSLHENSSVFAAEALMAGRPLLTTACGGHTEYLDDTLGRVVENDDVAALADGLDWMLDHYSEFDPAHLNAFARATFAEDVVVGRLLEVYREVLGG